MKKIFWGYLLVLLDLSIRIGENGRISMLPAFAGYVLLALGFRKLQAREPAFRLPCILAFLLIPVSAADYLLEALGAAAGHKVFMLVFSVCMSGLALAMDRLFIRALAAFGGGDLKAGLLERIWEVRTASTAVLYATLLPKPQFSAWIMLFLTAANIVWLYNIWEVKGIWASWPEEKQSGA